MSLVILAVATLSKIADLNVWMRDNINFSRLDKCCAVWYPKKREARFALTKAEKYSK